MAAKKIFTRPRKLLVLFIPLFLAGFGVSWGVSYLWMLHMDSCCIDTVGGRSYTSIAYIIILFLCIWTLKDMYNKAEATKAINRVVMLFSALVDSICTNITDSTITADSFIFYQNESTSDEKKADSSEMTIDLLVGALLAMVLFFVDAKQRSKKIAGAEAKEVVTATYRDMALTHDMVRDLFMRQSEIHTQNTSFAMLASLEVMVDYMERPLVDKPPKVPGISFVKRPDMVKHKIQNMRAKILESLFAMQVTSRHRWIQLPITIMGVLCPFLLPPIFYSTMAADILYIGPVLFFFLGGIVILNVFICDPVSFPLDVYSDPIYETIAMSVAQATSKYNSHFNKQSTTSLITRNVSTLSQEELRQIVRLYQTPSTNPEHVSRDLLTAALSMWMTSNNNDHID